MFVIFYVMIHIFSFNINTCFLKRYMRNEHFDSFRRRSLLIFLLMIYS